MLVQQNRLYSIRARLISLVLATALPLAAVAATFAMGEVGHKRSYAMQRATSLSIAVAAHLDDEIGNVSNLLLALGRSVSLDDGAIEANDTLLQSLLAEMPGHYSGIAVFAADGRNLGVAPPALRGRDLLDAQGRDYFLAARGGVEVAVSEPLTSRLSNRPEIVIARPIVDQSARTNVGVVAVGVSLERFARIFGHANMPPGAVVRITNDRGIVVVPGENADRSTATDLSDNPWVRRHLDAGTIAEEVAWADGTTRLTASVRATRVNWLVSIGIPQKTATFDLGKAYWRNGILGGGAVTLALLAAWAMSRRIAEPLRQLRDDTIKFSETGFKHRSAVRSSSEIGELATSFNMMAEQVSDASLRLQRLGEELNAIICASPIPILTVDRGGHVTHWNEAAERLWGYRAEHVLGNPAPLGRPGKPDGSEILFRRVLAGESILGLDHRSWARDGKPVDARLFAAPLQDAAGGTSGAVALWLDVTEQNALEARLRQSQKLDAVGQLAGGVAHDINNILGVVVANLDMLRASTTDRSDDRELVDAALEAALKGADLVQQILDFSRRQPLELRPIDLGATLEKWIPLLRPTLGERVRVALKPDADLWAAVADPERLESCVRELALNAREAMPDGGSLTIGVRNLSVDENLVPLDVNLKFGGYVVLSVTDTGTGIARDVLPRTFEPFFTTKEIGKGSGLGLAMVYGYMRQSGGTAKIYSELGHGTRVELYLPRAKDSIETLEGKTVAVAPRRDGGERILVVDDNPDMRGASVAMLVSLGYRTAEADDAAAALEAIQRDGPFSLIFSDIVMPGATNGIDLAREARRRGIKVLLTSGFASPIAVRAEAIAQGLDVLTKPFRKADLAARVRALLDSKPMTIS